VAIKLFAKLRKPKSRTLGFLKSKYNTQNVGWDNAKKYIINEETQVSSSTYLGWLSFLLFLMFCLSLDIYLGAYLLCYDP